MLKEKGFTLIELATVVAIVGILAATAVPLYRTLQQRTYGHEAVIMARQIMDAQVMYYLEHNQFWPEEGRTIFISHTTDPSDTQIAQAREALKIDIPVGHHVDYSLWGGDTAILHIASHNQFALFTNGAIELQIQMDRAGAMTYLVPGSEF